MIDPTLLLIVGAATAGGAVASHLPGIVSWTAGKLGAGKAAATSAIGAVESAVAHPLDTVRHAEHAMALKVSDECGRLITYLADKSPQQAQRAILDQIEAAKNKALDDLIAKLQAARQQ
jgi:hypothetical protein